MNNDFREYGDYLMHYGVPGMKWRHHHYVVDPPQNISDAIRNATTNERARVRQRDERSAFENGYNRRTSQQNAEDAFGRGHSRGASRQNVEDAFGRGHSRGASRQNVEDAFGRGHRRATSRQNAEDAFGRGARNAQSNSRQQNVNDAFGRGARNAQSNIRRQNMENAFGRGAIRGSKNGSGSASDKYSSTTARDFKRDQEPITPNRKKRAYSGRHASNSRYYK